MREVEVKSLVDHIGACKVRLTCKAWRQFTIRRSHHVELFDLIRPRTVLNLRGLGDHGIGPAKIRVAWWKWQGDALVPGSISVRPLPNGYRAGTNLVLRGWDIPAGYQPRVQGYDKIQVIIDGADIGSRMEISTH